jgi:hypothetical protein
VAQPQINKVKWGPQQGGLLSDVDPKEVSGGNLLVTGVNSGGMNIRNVGKGSNVMPDYEPIYGNELVYSLAPAVAQNKKWRVYADVTDVPTPSGANLIVNDDFATDLSGWNVTPAGTWIWNALGAYNNGNIGSISQFITGVNVAEYTLSFDISIYNYGQIASIQAVGASGNVVIATGVSGLGPNTFNFIWPYNEDFTLIFTCLNFADLAIDNVSLVLVDYLYYLDYNITSPSGNNISNGSDSFVVNNNISTTLTAIENFINSTFTFLSPSTSSTITNSYTGYVEFEFGYAPYFNYIIEFIEVYSEYASIELIVVQEPIDTGSIGEWNLIGSDDRTGYSFQFWTTRRRLPQELEILDVTDNGSGVIRVTTVEPHGLLPNQSVSISNVQGAVEANGEWTVDVIDSFSFDLYNSTFVSTYVSGGILLIAFYGLGEIGVAVKDDEGVVSYTRLLRSIEFNFTTLKQIDVRVKRKQDSSFAAYYTDNYNVPRVFYYKGEFIQDGALKFISSENIYEYGTIASESRWLINNEDFYIEVIGQDQSSGFLKSGNWRYSARLLTSDFSPTNWSQLTEGIPVFKDQLEIVNIIGSNPDVVTTKANKLRLVNNVPGLYTYVEIAALNYINNLAPSGVIIGRYQLNNDDEQFFTHFGSELAQIDLDTGTLLDFSQAFSYAQNVELLDNRAILSNLTPAAVYDFTEWVKTFKYSLNRKILTSIGEWTESNDAHRIGEYQDPMNVYSFKSHMMMETYRYGFRFKLRNGVLTQVYYPGYDIKIDPISALDPLKPEKIVGTFTTYDLTNQAVGPTDGPTEVYSIYISWQNINLSFLIDGVPVYELVSEIIPCRADVIPEVIASGNLLLGVSGECGFYDPGLSPPPTAATSVFNVILPGDTSNSIRAYPFYVGEAFQNVPSANNGSPLYLSSRLYPGTQNNILDPLSVSNFIPERKSFFFYAPDFTFSVTDFRYRFGDQLHVLGSPTSHALQYREVGLIRSYYGEYDGYTNVTSPDVYTFPLTSTPELYGYVPSPIEKTIDGRIHRNNNLFAYEQVAPADFPTFGGQYNYYSLINERSLVGRVSADIIDNNMASNPDYGFYRAIYYRPLVDKYGDILTTIWTEFLTPYRIGDNKGVVTSGEFDTYGDVFTQKTFLRQRYPENWDTGLGNWIGLGSAVGYYTQNRGNLQLRCAVDDTFDTKRLPTKINPYGWYAFGRSNPSDSSGVPYNADSQYLYVAPNGTGRDAQLFYNTGYTPVNNIITQRSFNPLLEYQTDWGNAIAWSDLESEGSNTDNLRNFPPLNLKFLDYTQGPITDARSINGELYTIQNTEVQRQYFNSTAMTTTTGGEVYLGTGAALSRRGTTMNKFGSRHKWSIIMGLSDKGGEVLYGIDDINNTVWRLGYDGTNSLDQIQGMKSFFANNLDWIRGKYTPAHDEGIRGVANQRYREVLWTLRGRKQYPEWQSEDNKYYSFGFESNLGNELVYNGNFASSGTLSGWDSLDATAPYAANLAWVIQYELSLNTYAANTATSGLEGLLGQTTPIPFVTGNTYVITIDVPIAPVGAIGVAFQLGGPYTSLSYGLNTFSYVALPGDNNVYIYSALGANAYIGSVSVKEVLNTNANWIGGSDWILSNNEACTNGLVGTTLVHDVPDYITPNMPWIVDFTISTWNAGDLRLVIGNVTTVAIGISGPGQYQAAASPTAPGVVRFQTAPTFDGCIKGNIRVYSTGVLKEYNTNDIVQTSGYGSIMSTWSQTPDLWRCLKNNVTSNPYFPPDPSDPDWELIPHTDPNYYTEYTIVYNELKNKFQTFMSILPRIYAHFQNGYLVPRPISNTGRMYISDSGDPTTWFEEGIDAQEEDAFIEPVINTPGGRKRFLAVRVESDVAPTSMSVTTSTTPGGNPPTTFAAEFEQREGNEFDGYVKDDVNDSIVQGDYAVFRFTIAATTYNKINSFIASVRERARKWFK